MSQCTSLGDISDGGALSSGALGARAAGDCLLAQGFPGPVWESVASYFCSEKTLRWEARGMVTEASPVQRHEPLIPGSSGFRVRCVWDVCS